MAHTTREDEVKKDYPKADAGRILSALFGKSAPLHPPALESQAKGQARCAVHSTLPRATLTALDQVAAAMGFSRSRMIRAAVHHSLRVWADQFGGVDHVWVNTATGEISVADPRKDRGTRKTKKGGTK